MNILQVINEFSRGGGAEKFLLDLSIALKKEGHDVTILSIKKPVMGESDCFYNLVTEYEIPVYYLSNKIYSVFNIFRLCKFLSKNKFNVIHVHLFPSLYYVALVSFFVSHRTIVYTEHSTKNRRREIVFFKYLDAIIYSRYNKIVAISNEVCTSLKRHIKIKDVEVINNGIEVNSYKGVAGGNLRSELNISSNIAIVMMIARFVKGKDYYTLFKSLAYLSDNVHLVCVGDGPLLEKCKCFCIEHEISWRVHFLGLRSDIPALLNDATLVVLSSEHEGFSITMLEAMAARKPFIASAVPGLCDTIPNAALFFPYENEQKLAEQISIVLSSKEVYETFALRGFIFASQFDISVTVKKYLNIY